MSVSRRVFPLQTSGVGSWSSEGNCQLKQMHRCVLPCRLLPAISVTTCGTVLRRRRVDNTWPVTALTARSEAIYRLKIAISAYLTCILRPPPVGEGVHVGILPKHLVRKKTRMAWLLDGEIFFKDMFIRFDTIDERDRQRQTDGQTDTA